MIVYLYGPDSYRRLQKERDIIASFKSKNAQANLYNLDLSLKGEEEKLEEISKSTGLFSAKNLIVLEEIAKVSAQTIKLLKALLEDKGTTLIIRSEKKLPAKFSFLSKKPAVAQEFKNLEDKQLKDFIKEEAKNRKYSIKDSEISELTEVYGSDLWEITNEIEKRALGSNEGIHRSEKMDFFPAVNALRGQMPVGRKLKILNQILQDEEPAAVFNLMAALSQPDKKPAMANYDIAVKSGKLDYPEILLSIVLK